MNNRAIWLGAIVIGGLTMSCSVAVSNDDSNVSADADGETAQVARVVPAEQIEWINDARLEGVKSFNLWGDPAANEEHAMMRVFPAGFAPARHSHPSTESVVVVSGRLLVEHEGSEENVLGPGSYSEIPANMSHAVRCLEEEDCFFVLRAPGEFTIDFDDEET
jgi:quercetin dioxygenase-like cupin family protein